MKTPTNRRINPAAAILWASAFMLAALVPRLSYLTRLDWFMLGSTLIVMLTLFVMAGTSYLMHRDREDLVRMVDRAGRITFPILFAVFLLVVWLV